MRNHIDPAISSGSSLGDRIVNAATAARYIDVSKKTILKYAHARLIAFLMYANNSFRFRVSSLDYFLSTRTQKARSALSRTHSGRARRSVNP
jgi:hypothetical protein